MRVSDSTWELIVDYYKSAYAGVHPPEAPIEEFAQQRISSAESQVATLKAYFDGRGRVLDAGCGIGAFVCAANLAGFDVFGYDPDPDAEIVARALAVDNELPPERIGTPQGKFRFVTSFEVAEHVEDLDSYFASIARSLAEDGRLYVETPNYRFPYEPHFWLPMIPGPRWLRWTTIGLARRSRSFFASLNFVTPRSIERSFRTTGLAFNRLGPAAWRTADRNGWIRILSALRSDQVGIYTPMIYVAQVELTSHTTP